MVRRLEDRGSQEFFPLFPISLSGFGFRAPVLRFNFGTLEHWLASDKDTKDGNIEVGNSVGTYFASGFEFEIRERRYLG